MLIKRLVRQLLLTSHFWFLCIWFRLTEPPRLLNYHPEINRKLLQKFGAKIGHNNVRIHGTIVLNWKEPNFSNLTIADNCVLNGNNFLDLYDQIILEEGVSIGPGVVIMTHNSYDTNEYLNQKLAHQVGTKPVHIKAGASVKANALIVHGVTICENAVVAGGAVVTRNVENNHFVTGIPATTKMIITS